MLPLPAHPQEATASLSQYLEKAGRISPEHQAWATAFAGTEHGQKLLLAVFGNSPYLSQLLLKNPVFFEQAMKDGYDDAFGQLLEDIQHLPAFTRTEEVMEALRIAKQKAALLIALADITGEWKLEKVTSALSVFATFTLNVAVNFLLQSAAHLHEITLEDATNPSKHSGLIVLAMGKMGSQELNYSSDIDLVIFFDSDKVRYIGKHTAQHFCVRFARDLVRIMQERTSQGYVFRTDLRLRPDPGSTPLAVSVSAAEIYYKQVGQNWERAAMIKARAVAGDIACGEHFLQKVIRPFIWRKYLDFAAIEDIRSIKRQIESKNGQVAADLGGYNIKIGHGGIREIEFFVQTQQLIWGGREPLLRVDGTCNALAALAKARHITHEAAEELAHIYRYYRMLEHRLQMVADHQTHSLPTTEAGLAHIAIFMGYTTTEDFITDLRQKLATVKKHYRALFPSSASLGADGKNLVFTGIENDPETVKAIIAMGFTDGEMICGRIRGWHHGRYPSTQTKRARELLTELVPQILKSMAQTASPDMAFLKFDEFLSRLQDGVLLFSLLYAHPHILNLIAELMGSYPYLAENLSRKPALLDYVLCTDFLGPFSSPESLTAELGTLLKEARDYEDALDIIRRWTHERQFQVGVQLVRGIISPFQARRYLSDIAETVLAACLNETEKSFAAQHGTLEGGKIAIVAMGKLGGRNLSFRSDIDLILVYDAPAGEEASLYYNRLSRLFINALTARSAEGKLYEVDMRLRPSGNDGPLCTHFKTLDVYFDSTAQSWEYMALTRGRVIMAEEAFGAAITSLIHTKLTKHRMKETLAADIIDIRRRIDQVHHTTDSWKVKYVRGGLIDIEFIAQFLQLIHASQFPALLSTDTVNCFTTCAEHGIIPAETATTLAEAALFLFDIQSILRLAYEGKLTQGVKNVLVSTLKQQQFDDIERQLLTVEQQVREYFSTIIG